MASITERLHLPHPRPSPADIRLHADEVPHRRMDVFAWGALALAGVSFLLAAVGGSTLGLAVGIVALIAAVYGQLVSATTSERWIFIPAWVMAALSASLNGFFLWSP
jgi:hypothetical protein